MFGNCGDPVGWFDSLRWLHMQLSIYYDVTEVIEDRNEAIIMKIEYTKESMLIN